MIAAFKASKSVGLIKCVLNPIPAIVPDKEPIVPPYKLFAATISSPVSHTVIINPIIAAVPEANATAPNPPSKAAILCCRASTVGLDNRE